MCGWQRDKKFPNTRIFKEGSEHAMPIKSFRPTTPTRRFQTYLTRDDITKDTPEKSLVEGKKRTGGRTSNGRISSRFIGGGAKQAYRLIDFKRDKTASLPKWRRSSMIRTARRASRCCTMSMAKSATSFRRSVSKSAAR